MTNIPNPFASAYLWRGDRLILAGDCLVKLQNILKKLSTEDSTSCNYRRAIAYGQNVRKDLLPLLLHLKDDSARSSNVIDVVVKILATLTVPVEHLLPVEATSRTEVGRRTIYELNKLLTSTKDTFTDARHVKVLMDHIKFVVEGEFETSVDAVNDCLLLLRNLLNAPEGRVLQNGPHSTLQNQLVWNLFAQDLDKVIIYLISCPQRRYWSVTVVQLVALLYKDQDVGNLQKLINLWLEASLSESSDDNESNTSPPEQGSDDSSPVITSDPTSDSSDSGESAKMGLTRGKSSETETTTTSGISSARASFDSTDKKECPSSQSEDFGYVTQVENPEAVSTSSNEDDLPIQQTPPKNPFGSGRSRITVLESQEIRRKKLLKRNKTNTINIKLLHHRPTDEDIADILKEFTVDFLLKGYNTLTQDLHSQLLSKTSTQMDTSHFFWLATYFLKFATQLELDLEQVSEVLSPQVVSFLVFQGVLIYEELELHRKAPEDDLKPSLRRLHLVVTAMKEFMQALDAYQRMSHLSENDRKGLLELEGHIADMDDLGSLFLVLLREYDPNVQSRQYLQDLILTNHGYLLLLDRSTKGQGIVEHLKQFATPEIMCHYGHLLCGFRTNGEFLNNCLFTMMHHIAGDLELVTALYHPSILKPFSLIWDEDYELCDDWSDLIEYLIHKFTDYLRSNPVMGKPCKRNKPDNQVESTTQQHPIEIQVGPDVGVDDGIGTLTECLRENNMGKFLSWLQKILTDTCRVKSMNSSDLALRQPIVYHYAVLDLPIPVVPRTTDQSTILRNQYFVLLLHKLGFYLPRDTGKPFVTIPNFWNAEQLLSVARRLGPIDSGLLPPRVVCVSAELESDYLTRVPSNEKLPPRQNHVMPMDMLCSPILNRNSASETASITSDLTRMCVSDEEDRLILVVEKN